MKLSKLIKRDWRNWNTPSVPSKRSSSQLSSGYDNSEASGIDIKPLKNKPVSVKAVKYKNRVKKAVPTMVQNSTAIFNKLKQKYNGDIKHIIKHRIDEHRQELDWSDEFEYYVNSKASRNTFKEHINSKDKRLQSMFARLISKYAEDYAGEATIGEDEWDIDELMLRSITKRNSHHMHEYFHNRTIFFFGDNDGRRIIHKCSVNNKVYWFNRDHDIHDISKDFKGTAYKCETREQLINIIKGIR